MIFFSRNLIDRGYFLNRTCLICLIGLLSSECFAQETSASFSYLIGDQTINGLKRHTVLETVGQSLSISLGFNEQWQTSFSVYQQSDSLDYQRQIHTHLNYQSSGWSIGITRNLALFWLSAQFQNGKEDLKFSAESHRLPQRLMTEETLQLQGLSVELGRAWLGDIFDTSLAAGLSTVHSDVRRTTQAPLVSLGILAGQADNEALKGTDLMIHGMLTFPFDLPAELTCLPSVGIRYQHNITGSLTGSTTTTYRRNNLSQSQRSSLAGINVQTQNQAILELIFTIMNQHWWVEIGGFHPWLIEPHDTQWNVTLGVSF